MHSLSPRPPLLQGQPLLRLSHVVPENNFSVFSDLPAGVRLTKQPALPRKRSGIATFAMTSISAEPLPNQKSSQKKNPKIMTWPLKTSALNRRRTALSTIIPRPPSPPYLTRTRVKNSPVGVKHFRARISAGPDPAPRAASLPTGRVWPISSVSGSTGAGVVAVFSGRMDSGQG